ncbi:MAG: hypothetical protein DRQ89_13680, partial [Epsilonproteobacteria bacterium]
MKKLIFIFLALLISFSAIGQAHHKKGERVGENGVLVDSIMDENGQLVPYVSGVKDSWYNDSIVIL